MCVKRNETSKFLLPLKPCQFQLKYTYFQGKESFFLSLKMISKYTQTKKKKQNKNFSVINI